MKPFCQPAGLHGTRTQTHAFFHPYHYPAKQNKRRITVEERDRLLRQLERVPSAMVAAAVAPPDAAAAAGDGSAAAAPVPLASAGSSSSGRLSVFNLGGVAPGGSLLNTLVGVARLGAAASGGARPLRLAMAGCVGGRDRLGAYVRQRLRAAGVAVVRGEGGTDDGTTGSSAADASYDASSSTTTGTIIVFCTPDAQRSFLSCIPRGERVALSPALLRAARRSRLVVVEGYLLDLPGAAEALPALVAAAKAAGAVVALTMGDAGVAARGAATVAACVEAGADVVFANRREAMALTGSAAIRALLAEAKAADGDSATAAADEASAPRDAAEAAARLARLAPVVVVTDGSRGSHVAAFGALRAFPPHWTGAPAVDTCGAGDGYCAGLLFALLAGHDLGAAGRVAAHAAAAVVARRGPQLDAGDARSVVLSAARALAADGAAALEEAADAGAPPGRALMAVLEARALLAAEEMAAAAAARRGAGGGASGGA